jgi:Ca2+/Na+ antiporter
LSRSICSDRSALITAVFILPALVVRLGGLHLNPVVAAANMTGSNRLLMGLGWPLVVVVALAAARKLHAGKTTALQLDPGNRVELGFLLIAGVVAFGIPASGHIDITIGVALLVWFGSTYTG